MLAIDEYQVKNDYYIKTEDPLTERFRSSYNHSEKKIITKDVHILNDKTGSNTSFESLQMSVNCENQLYFCQLLESIKTYFDSLDDNQIYIWDEI